MQKFEHGVYTVTDIRWGMALDLSSADNRSPVAFGSHGWENQQVSARLSFFPSFVRVTDGVVVPQKVGVSSLWGWRCHEERQQWFFLRP